VDIFIVLFILIVTVLTFIVIHISVLNWKKHWYLADNENLASNYSQLFPAASWVKKVEGQKVNIFDRQLQISVKSIKRFQFEFLYCMCRKNNLKFTHTVHLSA